MAVFSGVHFLTGLHCTLRPTTKQVYSAPTVQQCLLVLWEKLVRCALFQQTFTLDDPIVEWHACALRVLEALPCMRSLAFLWGAHSSYQLALYILSSHCSLEGTKCLMQYSNHERCHRTDDVAQTLKAGRHQLLDAAF